MIFSILVILLTVFSAANVIISNTQLSLEFDSSSGGLLTLIDQTNPRLNMAQDASRSTPLWKMTLVDELGSFVISSFNCRPTSFSALPAMRLGSLQYINLTWSGINLKQVIDSHTDAVIDVTLSVSLTDSSPYSEWTVLLSVISGRPVGIWEVIVSLPLSIGGKN